VVYQGIRPSNAAIELTLPDVAAREKREKEILEEQEKREKARNERAEKAQKAQRDVAAAEAEDPPKFSVGTPLTAEEVQQAVRSAYSEGGLTAAVAMIDSGMTAEEIEAVGKGEADITMGELGVGFEGEAQKEARKALKAAVKDAKKAEKEEEKAEKHDRAQHKSY
jgi:hypothetical protein